MQAICARHGGLVAWTAAMAAVALVIEAGSLVT